MSGAEDAAPRAMGSVVPMAGPDRMDLIEWYAELGWALVPLERGGKKPRADVASGWSSYRLARADVRATFADDCNVGVLLGEPSRGLLDGDLDCKEALELATLFLPDNPLTFGRLSTPKAHALYIGSSPLPDSLVVQDIPPPGKKQGKTLVELRSTGRQTMFPPSIHPDGEVVEWSVDPDEPLHPQPVDGAELRRCLELLGAACLVARHHFAGMEAARLFAVAGLPRKELLELPAGVQAKIAELCHAPRPAVAKSARSVGFGEGWIARLHAVDVAEVAEAVGLTQLRSRSWGPCPACTSEKRGSHDKRGAIGIRRDGRGWACHACKTTGDAVGLAAWTLFGTPRPANWGELRAALQERGIV